MPGILDFLNTPDAQLGIGLLAAGGPTTDPNQTGLGQRVAGAMSSVRDQQAQMLKQKYMQAQIDDASSQAAMRTQQLAMSRRQMDIQSQLLGFGPSASTPDQSAPVSGMGVPAGGAMAGPGSAAPSGVPAMGTPPTAGAPTQASGGTLDAMSAKYRIPVEALKYDLVFNGGKGIAEMVAKRGPDMQVTNGYAYDKNQIGSGFLPSVSTSQDGKTSMILPDPATGMPVVSAPQGALQTATDYARSAAGLKPIKVYNPTTGREEFSNEAAVAQPGGGAAMPAPVSSSGGRLPMLTQPTGNYFKNMPAPAAAAPDADGKMPTGRFIGSPDAALRAVADIKDPQDRANALQALTGQASMSPTAAPGGNVAAGPSATEKAVQDANAKYTSKTAEDAASYKNALDDRVAQGSDLNMRLQESVKTMQGFQTGGGKEVRAQAAQVAQAFGAPANIVNGIAGGDLGSMQEFNKLAVQQAMEQLKSSMGGAGRIAQAEFKVFQANNPNLDTDPSAVKKIFDFNTHLYNRDLSEQQQYQGYTQQGGNPANWRSEWSNRLQQQGFTNPGLNAQQSANVPTQAAAGKSFKDFGYASPADAIKDAQNAMLRNPAAKAEIMKRLQGMGVPMPGATGSW